LSEAFRLIKPACPKCGKMKLLKIPISVFEQKGFGFVKIQVPKGAVCQDHQFIVISDGEARIIGYEAIDKAISLEEERREEELVKEKTKDFKFSLKSLIYKFGFNSVAGLLHAKLFKYETLIVRSDIEPEVNVNDLNEYFDKMIPEPYKNSVKIDVITYDSDIYSPGYYYVLIANKIPKAFLLNPLRFVIQMPWSTNIEYESNIINYALQKEDLNEQYKVLSDSIQRFILDSEVTEQKLKEVKKISEKNLIKMLDKELTLSTINKGRMGIIKEFLVRRKSPDIISKVK
jgi:hypothetical protein